MSLWQTHVLTFYLKILETNTTEREEGAIGVIPCIICGRRKLLVAHPLIPCAGICYHICASNDLYSESGAVRKIFVNYLYCIICGSTNTDKLVTSKCKL